MQHVKILLLLYITNIASLQNASNSPRELHIANNANIPLRIRSQQYGVELKPKTPHFLYTNDEKIYIQTHFKTKHWPKMQKRKLAARIPDECLIFDHLSLNIEHSYEHFTGDFKNNGKTCGKVDFGLDYSNINF